MNFKETIRADVTNVFLNLSEFADWHLLDGRKVRAVVEDDILEDEVTVKFHRQQEKQQTRLYNADIVVYVSAAEFGKPKPGSVMEFDGKQYIVLSTSEQDGIYEIDMRKAGGR